MIVVFALVSVFVAKLELSDDRHFGQHLFLKFKIQRLFLDTMGGSPLASSSSELS